MEGKLPESFYEVNIYSNVKTRQQHHKKIYRPKSLMNIYAKIFSNIFSQSNPAVYKNESTL